MKNPLKTPKQIVQYILDNLNGRANCGYYGKICGQSLIFDNDPKGNGDSKYGWYVIKFYNNHCRITCGGRLYDYEKQKILYSGFKNIDDLLDGIKDFNKMYFKDYKRRIKISIEECKRLGMSP